MSTVSLRPQDLMTPPAVKTIQQRSLIIGLVFSVIAALGALLRPEEFFRAYLLAIANRQIDTELRAKGGASDIVQETFLEAQRDFGQFGGNTEGELRAWLVRLMANNLANFIRSYRATGKRQVGREIALRDDTPAGQAGWLAAMPFS